MLQPRLGRYAPPITLGGFTRTTRAKYYGVGANLGLGAMTPLERGRLIAKGMGAPSSESHPEIISKAEQVYSNSGFSASCAENKTPWGPQGQFYYNRLCALNGGAMSHAADPIAENYGDRLPQYMIDLVRGELAAESKPGAAVVTPQGIYSVDQQGRPTTTSFYTALTQSGVSPAVAASVAQSAAPAPGPGRAADRGATDEAQRLASDPKTKVYNAGKVEANVLTYDQWNYYHNLVLGHPAPLSFEAALPNGQRGAKLSIDQFWAAAYGLPAPTVPQSGLVPAGTPPAGSAAGGQAPPTPPVQAPPAAPVTPGGGSSTAAPISAASIGGVLTTTVFGIPVWMLAAGGAGLYFLSAKGR